MTGPQALDDQSLRRRDAGQVGDEFWRAVEVVGPSPRDTFGIAVVFDPGLEHALEGHHPHERQRGEQDQAERINAVPIRVAAAISPRATSPADTEPRNMVARPVDSAVVAARAP